AADKAIPAALERIRSDDLATTALALLEMDRDFAEPPSWLAQAADVAEAEILAIAKHPEIERLPGGGTIEALTTKAKWSKWLEALLTGLARHHREHPLLPGMEMELCRTQLPYPVPAKLFRGIVDRLAREKRIVREDSLVRLPEHRVKLKADEREATTGLERLLERGGYTPPDLKQMAEELKLPPKRVGELLQALEREGRAAKVSDGLYYHSEVLKRLREMIAERIHSSGPLGAAEFRDMIDASRKFSIALLEYFDRTGFTIRVGDQRKLRKG
ncbi:MAG: SelB C-terminal domain-containing protein, partial [Candidatus Binatia bacterium]